MMTCAIIDDEPLAVKLLESYVEKTPFLHLCGTYNSAVDALYTLQAEPVDLLFLDIQMPGLDGLDFAKVLGGKSRIVFTTAFSQYAVDSYKVNAVDYLLKPVSYADFLTAASKARDQRAAEDISIPSVPSDEPRSFFVKSDYRLVRICVPDILYVECLKDYVKIYLDGTERPVLSLTSMRTVEESLPSSNFMRVHRSYIVNMDKVTALERGQVVIGEKRFTVSESYKDKVQDYVNRHLLRSRGTVSI